jgi:hypothetical protein
MAVGFMLAHPYGFTRVMSSYYWPRNFQNGKVSLNILLKKEKAVLFFVFVFFFFILCM